MFKRSNQVRTVGELKKRLENLPDDLMLHQKGITGGFHTIMNVSIASRGDEDYDELLSNIKRYISVEDKIRGTYRSENVETIIVFNHGSDYD